MEWYQLRIPLYIIFPIKLYLPYWTEVPGLSRIARLCGRSNCDDKTNKALAMPPRTHVAPHHNFTPSFVCHNTCLSLLNPKRSISRPPKNKGMAPVTHSLSCRVSMQVISSLFNIDTSSVAHCPLIKKRNLGRTREVGSDVTTHARRSSPQFFSQVYFEPLLTVAIQEEVVYQSLSSKRGNGSSCTLLFK